MNLGLIELPRALRQFLTRRNSSTQPFQLQDATPGSVVGGNARGAGAVDLQMSRGAADQVASGNNSFMAGANNIANAGQSVAIGGGNSAGAVNSVAIGASNTTTASLSVAMGGSNSASGTGSVAMGASNTASGTNSSIPGGTRATANSILGLLAYGFSGGNVGQNQMSFFGARPTTTGTTTTRATADNASASLTNQLTLRNNSAFRVNGRVVARDTVTNDCKEWEFTGLIKRGAAAANTSLVGTPSITSQFADTAAAAWTIAVSADTTNGALAIDVTGAGANAIRWTVVVWSQEVA